MNPETLKKIPLTDQNPKANFELKYSFSFIKVVKVQADSLMKLPDAEWTELLNEINLVFICTDKRGAKKTTPYNLGSQISPYHVRPIIEFRNLIIPEENKSKMTALGNYFNNLTMEIQGTSGKKVPKISLSVYIETSPGVELAE